MLGTILQDAARQWNEREVSHDWQQRCTRPEAVMPFGRQRSKTGNRRSYSEVYRMRPSGHLAGESHVGAAE